MSSRKLFGTDGVRGRANSHPMTAELALRLGAAAGRYFRRGGQDHHRVVIGKDTRLSGYMLENALTAGLTSTGMNVLLLGPVPTPAVGFLTRSMRADLGIMISASHNPAADNGIKFFGPDGFKLSDEAEAEIERIVAGAIDLAQPQNIGRAKRIDDGRGRYVEYAKTTFPAGHRLDGLKVVIDCANGAAYRAAPDVLWELGAEVIPLGVDPNGLNINEGVGSTHPEACAAAVRAHGARRSQDARADARQHREFRKRPAPRRGGRTDDFARDLGREGAGIARAAFVGRKLDPPAARQQHLGQGLGGEHVPPGAARGDQAKRRGHPRLRPSTSPIRPCGRVRVSASSMPTAMPEAMTEEPP